jgi:serine/threonine protein kinase
MELVEGETIAERLQRGPMRVEDALNIARQIAEALEAAHEKGVIHRDLKPANVKITPDERVKVLARDRSCSFPGQFRHPRPGWIWPWPTGKAALNL